LNKVLYKFPIIIRQVVAAVYSGLWESETPQE